MSCTFRKILNASHLYLSEPQCLKNKYYNFAIIFLDQIAFNLYKFVATAIIAVAVAATIAAADDAAKKLGLNLGWGSQEGRGQFLKRVRTH